jgi:hypothetical protein
MNQPLERELHLRSEVLPRPLQIRAGFPPRDKLRRRFGNYSPNNRGWSDSIKMISRLSENGGPYPYTELNEAKKSNFAGRSAR